MSVLWQAATSPNLQHIHFWREVSFHPAGVSLAVQLWIALKSPIEAIFDCSSLIAHIPSNNTHELAIVAVVWETNMLDYRQRGLKQSFLQLVAK